MTEFKIFLQFVINILPKFTSGENILIKSAKINSSKSIEVIMSYTFQLERAAKIYFAQFPVLTHLCQTAT